MSAKKIVEAFYNSEALVNEEIMDSFLHPDVVLDWNSSKGFLQLKREDILSLAAELNRAYESSRVVISHIVNQGDTVAVRYSQYVKTIENPRERMLLAHFFVIWEIVDDKLYRGYQMSQLS